MPSVQHDLKVVDNVFVKMMVCVEVGDIIHGHAHAFDHITLLATGSVVMSARGNKVEYKAPKLIVTPKGVVHQFTALEANTTLCCIHAIRDGDEMEDIAPPDITLEQAEKLMLQFPLIRV
jgi:quercetin dioxygenase-like cupin family protein